VFLEQLHESVNVQVNLGRLSHSKTYILYLYEFFKCHVSKLIIELIFVRLNFSMFNIQYIIDFLLLIFITSRFREK
jgi:hypothetical protein